MQPDELLRVLTEASPMLIAYVDAQRRYRYANRRYGQHFHRTLEQVIDRPVWEVMGLTMYQEVRGHIDAALSGRTVIHELRVHRAEVGERWLSAMLIPHVAAPGEVAGFIVLAHDVTERRSAERTAHSSHKLSQGTESGNAEDALKASEVTARAQLAELEHLFHTSPVGLAMHDRQRRIVRISERLAAIDGLSVEEHLGRTLSEVLPAVGAEVDPIVQRVLDSGEPAVNLEITVPNPVAAQSQFVGLASFHGSSGVRVGETWPPKALVVPDSPIRQSPACACGLWLLGEATCCG